MSMSESQRGVLRRQNLAKPPTISDHRPAELEYTYESTILPETGRTGVVIYNVKVLDGHITEDSDYLFIVKHQGGHWRNVSS